MLWRLRSQARRYGLGGGPDGEGFEGWGGEEVALHVADAEVLEGVLLGEGFDAFGDELDVELAADLDDGADDDAAGEALVDVAGEGDVDLEDVGTEGGEEGEACESGAEVVDGDAQAALAEVLDGALELGGLADALLFGDFEDEAIEREAGALGCGDGGGEIGDVVGGGAGVDVDGEIGAGGEDAEEEATSMAVRRQVAIDAGAGLRHGWPRGCWRRARCVDHERGPRRRRCGCF